MKYISLTISLLFTLNLSAQLADENGNEYYVTKPVLASPFNLAKYDINDPSIEWFGREGDRVLEDTFEYDDKGRATKRILGIRSEPSLQNFTGNKLSLGQYKRLVETRTGENLPKDIKSFAEINAWLAEYESGF